LKGEQSTENSHELPNTSTVNIVDKSPTVSFNLEKNNEQKENQNQKTYLVRINTVSQ